MKKNSTIKMIYIFNRGLLASAVLSVCTALAADTPATTQNTQGSGASRLSSNAEEANTDAAIGSGKTLDAKSFLKEAIEGNSAEIALAEVAERQAQSSEVKEFAKMIRQDHQKANQKLQPLAQAHGVAINQSLDAKHQKKLDRFQKLSGSEFDKEYAKDMLKDHQKDISKYEKAAKQLTETDVQQYAQSTLPTLRQHLQHAQHTAQAVGVDQDTISSIMKKSSDSMGGSVDSSEKAVGGSDK
jgi:putative membrane protein